ncbi:MAG: class I SAM-dependent methyltransferase [Alphaproteobacteria bacterium]
MADASLTTQRDPLAAWRKLDAVSRMIARLTSQKAALTAAAERLVGIDGMVLEVGLGKGRTWDLLGHLLPERRRLALDREVHAPAALRPAADQLMLGELSELMPRLARDMPGQVALAHVDCGGEGRAADAAFDAWLPAALHPLLAAGAVVAQDRPRGHPRWRALPAPAGMTVFPYYLYRKDAT